MAYSLDHDQHGYDERRFEGPVKRDLFCSICHEVLRNPRTCQNQEHPFCLNCISEHLQFSHTCPECREFLSPETLKDPSRFLKNDLSELKIKCDYNERGCPGYVLLENLQHHVDRCGFAPVMCGNEGCGMVVNRKEIESHEKDECLSRVGYCHNCKEIKECQVEMKAEISEVQTGQNEMKGNLYEMKAIQDETKLKIGAIERKQNEIMASVEQIKRTQAELVAGQATFKKDVKQQLQSLTDMVNRLLLQTSISFTSSSGQAAARKKHEIIILGGWCGETVLNTVENYKLDEKSTPLPLMIQNRGAAACFVLNNSVFVVGGHDGRGGTDSMEILKMNQGPFNWVLSACKMPEKLRGHAAVVHQNKMIVVGGAKEDKVSDTIREVNLTAPYKSKLLGKMPKPRSYHSAEIVNGKMYILGGTTTGWNKDAMDSVLAHDLSKSGVKPCTPLPYAACNIATVTWGNMIIIIGGLNNQGQALNEVIMYDTDTGHYQRLPSLLYKRAGCAAVMVNDVIVAMGGRNADQGHLSSVECFILGNESWRQLPEMLNKRFFASAVVKPEN